MRPLHVLLSSLLSSQRVQSGSFTIRTRRLLMLGSRRSIVRRRYRRIGHAEAEVAVIERNVLCADVLDSVDSRHGEKKGKQSETEMRS
jgi:hypothetical protein